MCDSCNMELRKDHIIRKGNLAGLVGRSCIWIAIHNMSDTKLILLYKTHLQIFHLSLICDKSDSCKQSARRKRRECLP